MAFRSLNSIPQKDSLRNSIDELSGSSLQQLACTAHAPDLRSQSSQNLDAFVRRLDVEVNSAVIPAMKSKVKVDI